jgi:hypothetical protein
VEEIRRGQPSLSMAPKYQAMRHHEEGRTCNETKRHRGNLLDCSDDHVGLLKELLGRSNKLCVVQQRCRRREVGLLAVALPCCLSLRCVLFLMLGPDDKIGAQMGVLIRPW